MVNIKFALAIYYFFLLFTLPPNPHPINEGVGICSTKGKPLVTQ